MKNVAFDMDGVMVNWDLGFRAMVRMYFPDVPVVEYQDRKDFYAVKDYPEELRPKLKPIAYSAGFYRDLPPVAGAIEVVKRIAIYHDVILLTAPMTDHMTCAQEKIGWVREHLGKEWQDRVYIAKDKTRVHADFLVDDKPGITGVRTPTWEHLLMDAPYNRTYDKVQRVTWETLEDVLADRIATTSR